MICNLFEVAFGINFIYGEVSKEIQVFILDFYFLFYSLEGKKSKLTVISVEIEKFFDLGGCDFNYPFRRDNMSLIRSIFLQYLYKFRFLV